MLNTNFYNNNLLLAANVANNIASNSKQVTTLSVKRAKRYNALQSVILAQSSSKAKQLRKAKQQYSNAVITLQANLSVNNKLSVQMYTTALQSAKNNYFAAKKAILVQSN